MTGHPRFLVLRGGAIGDFVLTLPAIRALRERWPEAWIEIIGYPHIANLALAAGLADHVESLDRAGMAKFFALLPRFTEEQAAFIRSFDVVISYLHDPSETVRDNLRAAGAKQVVYGSPLVADGHAIDHLFKPLEAFAIYADEPPVPSISVRDPTRGRGLEWLREKGLNGRVTAIHPGSGSPKKNWSAERFAALATRMAGSAGSAFFILGEADDEVAAALRAAAPEIGVLEGRSLVDVAAVLSHCAAYVGNDSGITHIAAALGLPVVALFGPSDPDRWGPRGGNVRIVRAPQGNLGAITVDDVLAGLAAVGGLLSTEPRDTE